jgi:hypothetical protein
MIEASMIISVGTSLLPQTDDQPAVGFVRTRGLIDVASTLQFLGTNVHLHRPVGGPGA